MRVVVLHTGYGCDTCCCGHVIEVDGEQRGDFAFAHPTGGSGDAIRAFARELVTRELGAEHVSDLDWESCDIRQD